jgi:hypothetical protein
MGPERERSSALAASPSQTLSDLIGFCEWLEGGLTNARAREQSSRPTREAAAKLEVRHGEGALLGATIWSLGPCSAG